MSEAVAATESRLDAPELSVRAVGVLLLHFQKSYGAERLAEVWKKNDPGLPLSHVTTITNFVSLRFIERVIEMLVRESGEPDFAFKAGLRTATPEALGFLFHIFRTFGSPQICYRQLVQLAGTFNRVGTFDLVTLERTQMELTYTSTVPERSPYLCEGRKAQFASIPMIWGLPQAEVHELECQLKGGSRCRYRLSWTQPMRAWRAAVGTAIGVATAVGLTISTQLAALVAFPMMMFLGALGGAWLDARSEIRRKDDLLQTQNEGLMHSLRDLQRRNEEIFRTNQELESRVAERTHELQVTNEKLSGSLVQVQEMDRLKTQFFDNVSHELRTPLTLILLTLESLRNAAAATAEAEGHYDRLERSAGRLLRLINALLDLAKIGAGKMRLRYQQVDVRDLLNGVMIPFRVLAEDKRVALKLDAPDDLDIIHADFEKLDIVFQNLVSNALKFTHSGEVTVKVTQDTFYVHVAVRDTGAGISAEDLRIIFDRFAQADSAGTRRVGGTGIGLALVKETIELHGGNISVVSKPGEGSTFSVDIPRGTVHIREDIRERRTADFPVGLTRRAEDGLMTRRRDPAASSTSPGPGPADVSPTAIDPAKRTVLVVEDEPDLRAFITRGLRMAFNVIEAPDGQAGLERARELLPSVIISDVMMPRLSGLQLLSALRADPRTLDIPVILLTARQDIEARVHGLGEGANDYLGKPFAPRELVARIEAQLRLRDATARIAQTERLAATSLITSGFAHEVRNPLNGLMNALEPLKESLVGAQDREMAESMLRVIEESGQRIRHLAESLLGSVRDTGVRTPIQISKTFSAAERALAWKVSDKVTIEQVWESDDAVMGEAPALIQVWINLIDNAFRSFNGRHGGRIRLHAKNDGDWLSVSVSDDGCGIPPDVLPRLFEPFFSTRAAGEGTGLGLALCRRIVLAHGGQIHLRSRPGEGTEVKVRLPLAASAVINESTQMMQPPALA